jgi:undecaprenyl-diphosphatase
MPARTPLIWPLLALAAFAALLTLVLGDWPPLERADTAISDRFRAYGDAHPGAVSAAHLVTATMGTPAFLAVWLAVTVLLAVRRQWRVAAFTAAVAAVVPALWGLGHAFLDRPRPLDGFVLVDSNGFPSGHTSHAAATAVAGVLLLWPRLGAVGRTAAVGLGVAFAALLGLTRLALVVHWPSDVLGGVLLALAVVPLLAAVTRPRSAAQAPEPGSPPAPGCAAPASPGSG